MRGINILRVCLKEICFFIIPLTLYRPVVDAVVVVGGVDTRLV